MVIEKGQRWLPDQFPETNWNLKKWLWLPLFRFHGFFKVTMMRHVVFLSGVGVGGGSLVYANTLPRPEESFFNSGNWAGLSNWKEKLEPHYKEAERMLGSNATRISMIRMRPFRKLHINMANRTSSNPPMWPSFLVNQSKRYQILILTVPGQGVPDVISADLV